MKLAIASPSASTYSETFIRMQIERLPCSLRIHGGPVASETVPGGPIAPLRSLRGWLDTAVECGLRGTRWEGPQAKELGRRLRRAGVTTVLANYGPTGVALSPVCKALGVGLVVHFHGYDAHRTDVVSRHAEAYPNLGIDAAAVIAVSHHMAEALVEAGIPEDKIHLTRCGVDPERFVARSEPPTPPLFLGVGRFVDKKAPYLTLVAFAEARKAVSEARLVLAGEGELREATGNLAKALAIEESVDLVGVLSPDEVAGWMQKATALVQHSITPRSGPNAGDSEGTPVSVLEAMMSGVPVIGTRHAGIGEVIEDGRTGLLVKERDTASMAAAMVRLAGDAELTRSMGRSAREEALANYSADRYIETLRSVLLGVA